MIKETCDFNSRLLGISHAINPNNAVLVENTEKELLEVFDPVNKFLFQFRNNEKLIIKLIERVSKSEEIDDLVNLLCHFFYENILTQNSEQEEILHICYLLLEKDIENLKTPSVASFLDRSFIGRFLKSFTRRQDIKSYLSMILGDLILKMENSTENFLEVDPMRIYDHIKNKKMTEIFNKSFNLEKTKKIFEFDRKLMLGDRVRKTTITKKKTYESCHNVSKPFESDPVKLEKSASFVEKSNSRHETRRSLVHDFLNFEEFFETSSEDQINNDYLIDLTEEELRFRYEKEEMPEMKEFCKKKCLKRF
jgi:hypothetical protein